MIEQHIQGLLIGPSFPSDLPPGNVRFLNELLSRCRSCSAWYKAIGTLKIDPVRSTTGMQASEPVFKWLLCPGEPGEDLSHFLNVVIVVGRDFLTFANVIKLRCPVQVQLYEADGEQLHDLPGEVLIGKEYLESSLPANF